MTAVIEGDGYTGPSSWIAPVYPYSCALVFKLFGSYTQPSYLVIMLLQCIVSALTVVPIVLIGKRTVGLRSGYIAAFIWAVFPWFSVWAITWIWEMSLSAFLSALLFWYALRLEDSVNNRDWAGFGGLWGGALLVNPALMTLLPPAALWIARRRSQKQMHWLRPAVLACVTCIVVMSPWLVRNRIVFGRWMFLRNNYGFEFGLGNYHGSSGRGWAGNHPTGNPKEYNAYVSLGERAYLEQKSHLAMQFVREHPREFLVLTAKRVFWFWDGSAMRFNDPIKRVWMPWSFALVSLLLLPALWLAITQPVHGWEMFLGVILLYPFPYYLAYSQVRYRHALEPLMLLLIVSGLSHCRNRISRSTQS
jgi:4-amino-4-deoxy-L-arabinose transferase-like glycosyltransferase